MSGVVNFLAFVEPAPFHYHVHGCFLVDPGKSRFARDSVSTLSSTLSVMEVQEWLVDLAGNNH